MRNNFRIQKLRNLLTLTRRGFARQEAALKRRLLNRQIEEKLVKMPRDSIGE